MIQDRIHATSAWFPSFPTLCNLSYQIESIAGYMERLPKATAYASTLQQLHAPMIYTQRFAACPEKTCQTTCLHRSDIWVWAMVRSQRMAVRSAKKLSNPLISSTGEPHWTSGVHRINHHHPRTNELHGLWGISILSAKPK